MEQIENNVEQKKLPNLRTAMQDCHFMQYSDVHVWLTCNWLQSTTIIPRSIASIVLYLGVQCVSTVQQV